MWKKIFLWHSSQTVICRNLFFPFVTFQAFFVSSINIMKMFSIFGIAVVSCAKKLEFWNIEIIVYVQVKKIFIVMKSLQSVLKKLDCLCWVITRETNTNNKRKRMLVIWAQYFSSYPKIPFMKSWILWFEGNWWHWASIFLHCCRVSLSKIAFQNVQKSHYGLMLVILDNFPRSVICHHCASCAFVRCIPTLFVVNIRGHKWNIQFDQDLECC